MNQKKRELSHNELADALGERLEKIKPHLPRIAMIGGAILVGVIAIAFWVNSRRTINEVQWREYFFSRNQTNMTGDSRVLDKVGEMFPDTQPGQIALLSSADYNYAFGANNLIEDKEEFKRRLQAAAVKYEDVIKSNVNLDPLIKRRATYALAYTYEALGKFTDAAELYRRIIDEAPDAPITKLAVVGLDRVNDPSVVAIYDAFQEWTPSEIAPGPGPLLPTQPDISFPSADEIVSSELDPSDLDPPPSISERLGEESGNAQNEKGSGGIESKDDTAGEKSTGNDKAGHNDGQKKDQENDQENDKSDDDQ